MVNGAVSRSESRDGGVPRKRQVDWTERRRPATGATTSLPDTAHAHARVDVAPTPRDYPREDAPSIRTVAAPTAAPPASKVEVLRRLIAALALIVSLVGVGSTYLHARADRSAPEAALLTGTTAPSSGAPINGGADALSPPCQGTFCTASSPWASPGQATLLAVPGKAVQVNSTLIAAAAKDPPPDGRFGVVNASDAPFAAAYAGVGWERVNFAWSAFQPAGPHSWSNSGVDDALLNREAASGREVVGIIGGMPKWARSNKGLPLGLYLTPGAPGNTWGAFVYNLVKRYKTLIHHWIIWNEPDVWKKNTRGHTWDGTVADFAQLQKVAYLQIKRVGRGLWVHLAATTYWWDRAYGRPLYFGQLLDALSKDRAVRREHWYFDVVSVHVYDVPDDIERIIAIDRSLMHAHGIGKLIWVDETGADPTSDGPWPLSAPRQVATVAQQAAFDMQAAALAIAAGASRVEYYKMADPPNLSLKAYPQGLIRRDGTARPALAAVRAVTHAFAGFVSAVDLKTPAPIRAVAVDRGALGGVLALWNTGITPISVTVSLPWSSLEPPDWLAGRVAVVGDDDVRIAATPVIKGGHAMLTLTLAASTCARTKLCRIDGSPLLVVAPGMPHLAGVGR